MKNDEMHMHRHTIKQRDLFYVVARRYCLKSFMPRLYVANMCMCGHAVQRTIRALLCKKIHSYDVPARVTGFKFFADVGPDVIRKL